MVRLSEVLLSEVYEVVPTTDFPEMTSTTRTLGTAIDRARSLASAVILLTLTPAAG